MDGLRGLGFTQRAVYRSLIHPIRNVPEFQDPFTDSTLSHTGNEHDSCVSTYTCAGATGAGGGGFQLRSGFNSDSACANVASPSHMPLEEVTTCSFRPGPGCILCSKSVRPCYKAETSTVYSDAPPADFLLPALATHQHNTAGPRNASYPPSYRTAGSHLPVHRFRRKPFRINHTAGQERPACMVMAAGKCRRCSPARS